MKPSQLNTRIEKKGKEERFICPACISLGEIYDPEFEIVKPCGTCLSSGIIVLDTSHLSKERLNKLTTENDFNSRNTNFYFEKKFTDS